MQKFGFFDLRIGCFPISQSNNSVSRHYNELFPKRVVDDQQICAAALAVILADEGQFLGGMAINSKLSRKLELTLKDGQEVKVSVIYLGKNEFVILIGDKSYNVSGFIKDNELTCSVNGEISKQRVIQSQERIKLFSRNHGAVEFKQKAPKFLTQQLGGGSLGNAVAPMPGVVEKVYVKDGDQVKAGDPLVVMIAMKMEYVIKAPKAGKVSNVLHKVGDFVKKDTPLVKFAE